MWDLRSHRPAHHVYSPFVAGDTLDIDAKRNLLLTGSYADKDSLQLYDFKTLKLITNINPPTNSHIYASQVRPVQ